MNHYSQHTIGYEKIKLGTCNTTLWDSGCFCVSLAMMAYIDPIEVNDLLKKNGGYNNGCMINSEKAAKILKLKYDGKTTQKPSQICIVETRDFAPSVPQHFFIFAPRGTVSDVTDLILDPLNSSDSIIWEENKYNVVSFRLFRENVPKEDTEMQEALEWNNDYIPTPIVSKVDGSLKTDAEILLMLYRFKNGL